MHSLPTRGWPGPSRLLSLLGVVALSSCLASAHVIPSNITYTEYLGGSALESRETLEDPTVFTWVRRFAAVGDSYTAGIGAGERLGSVFHNFGDWKCSRYDLSYPMVFKNFLGSSLEDFQYPACTGDQTWQIYNQVDKLSGDLDLVTLTAGGNDLCLVDIIKECVILSFYGEKTCTAILDKAQSNLDKIVRNNIKQILLALDKKMAKDSIVVYNSYARFFNTENEDCATKQDWSLFRWVTYIWSDMSHDSLPLTVARRERFNKLTTGLNDLIRDVVHDVANDVKYKIGFSNWDLWPSDGVKGQMCDPSSTGAYPDPKQPDLLFFKPDTRNTWFKFPIKKRSEDGKVVFDPASSAVSPEAADQSHDDEEVFGPLDEEQLKALRETLPPPPPRDLDSNGIDRSIYKSSLWNSVNPRAAVLKQLDPRGAPDTPGCPSDSSTWLPGLGFFLPDFFGRIFHPNVEGQNAMASFAVAEAIDLRAKVLGVQPEVCKLTDEFKCWQKEGRKGYATADRLNENYKDFCDGVEAPGDGETGWKRSKTYHDGTPDEHEFVVETGENADKYNKDECLESMERIINGCDGNDPENPMNWKFGGQWKRNEYTYTVNIKRDNRPWPPIKKAHGSCDGSYHFLYSDYVIYGAGWSSWDYGQSTLLKNSRGCLGEGVTKWKFDYFDEPDSDGMEWKSTFRTPVFVNNRCYKNNKVAFASGGFTDGCSGSGWA